MDNFSIIKAVGLFVEAFTEKRTELGISLQDIQSATSINVARLSSIESLNADPSASEISQLAEALKIPVKFTSFGKSSKGVNS